MNHATKAKPYYTFDELHRMLPFSEDELLEFINQGQITNIRLIPGQPIRIPGSAVCLITEGHQTVDQIYTSLPAPLWTEWHETHNQIKDEIQSGLRYFEDEYNCTFFESRLYIKTVSEEEMTEDEQFDCLDWANLTERYNRAFLA